MRRNSLALLHVLFCDIDVNILQNDHLRDYSNILILIHLNMNSYATIVISECVLRSHSLSFRNRWSRVCSPGIYGLRSITHGDLPCSG